MNLASKLAELSRKEDLEQLEEMESKAPPEQLSAFRMAILLCLERIHQYDRLLDKLRQWQLIDFVIPFIERMHKRLGKDRIQQSQSQTDLFGQAVKLVSQWKKKIASLNADKLLNDLKTRGKGIQEEINKRKDQSFGNHFHKELDRGEKEEIGGGDKSMSLPQVAISDEKRGPIRRVPVIPHSILQNKILKNINCAATIRPNIVTEQPHQDSPDKLFEEWLDSGPKQKKILHKERVIQPECLNKEPVVQPVTNGQDSIFAFLDEFQNRENKVITPPVSGPPKKIDINIFDLKQSSGKQRISSEYGTMPGIGLNLSKPTSAAREIKLGPQLDLKSFKMLKR